MFFLSFTAESFYDSIANKYDWFFSSKEKAIEKQTDQICSIFANHNIKTILDCSCGNGLQSIALAKKGYVVHGGDISENMIAEAKRYAKQAEVDFYFKRSDFRNLHDNFTAEYDCVLSWGNSIPHLMNDSDLVITLKNIFLCTKNEGIAIIEMRNYDYLIREKPRFMPMRINDVKDNFRYSILYVLDYFIDLVRFNLVYLIENIHTGQKHMETQSVDYNPIQKDHFIYLLSVSGFTNIITNENNNSIIYIAEKNKSR